MDNNTAIISNPLSIILSGNYGDLLKWAGISHLQFSILVIVIFLLFSFFYLLYKMGMMQGIKFIQENLQQSTIVYRSFQGPNYQISTLSNLVIQETNTVFKFSQSIAMYFDSQEQKQSKKPQKQSSQKQKAKASQIKAIFGILVNKQQISKISMFLSKYPKYKKQIIPKTLCISTKYPYFNSMSFIAIVTRVYSQLKQYVKKNNIKIGSCTIQIYHLLGEQQYIKIIAPKQNFDCFNNFWYKPDEQQKKMRRSKQD